MGLGEGAQAWYELRHPSRLLGFPRPPSAAKRGPRHKRPRWILKRGERRRLAGDRDILPGMREITVEWDNRSSSYFKDKTAQRALLKAIKKAGADGLRAVRAEAKRQVRARVAIRAGYLANTALPLTFARGNRLDALEWIMRVAGRPVPLGEYPRRQTRKGVKVEIERGKRVLLTSAFIAQGRAPRKAVFLRPTKRRYPMGHRLGLSVADSMKDGQVPTAALEFGRARFETAFTRLLALELGR